MTHSETITLFINLQKLTGIKNTKLNYAIEKNLQKLRLEVEIYQKQENEIGSQTNEGILPNNYIKEKELISKKYLTKEGDSKDKEIELNKEIDELKTIHAVALKSCTENWEKLMDSRKKEQSGFTPYTIKEQHLPVDLSTEDMKLIYPIIKDNE